MALVDVIKYEVNDRELVGKFPSDKIALGSQLVVYPTQTAFFVKGGQICDEFAAGTYTIKTENIPLLGKLVNKPFGGESPFQAEVWFVNQVAILDGKWGTPAPIQIEDPKYNVIVPVKAFGQFGFHVANPRLFLERLVGNMPSFSVDKLITYFRGIILTKLTNLITAKLYAESLSVININAHVEAISAYAHEQLRGVFADYGIDLEMFTAIQINVDESDPSFRKLKSAKDDVARINIMGKENYQMQRSFDVLESAAENEGSGLVGTGVGIGAGVNIGSQVGAMFGQQLNTNPTASTPPPPLPSTRQFHIAVNGQIQGVMDTNTIIAKITARQLDGTALAWTEGMSGWQPLQSLPEFSQYFNGNCPPPLP